MDFGLLCSIVKIWFNNIMFSYCKEDKKVIWSVYMISDFLDLIKSFVSSGLLKYLFVISEHT